MTDAEHLADLRERFGPAATRVGDPPTAGDVELLLRMLDQPKCVDDAKVAEIRERQKNATGWERSVRQTPSQDSGLLRTEIIHKDPRVGWFVLASLQSFEQNVGDAEQMSCSLADIDTLLDALDAERDRLAAIAAKLRDVVCTEDPDTGVVLLSDDGPTHKEVINGQAIEVYDHEYFSPLGDALLEIYKLATADAIERGEHREGRDDDD